MRWNIPQQLVGHHLQERQSPPGFMPSSLFTWKANSSSGSMAFVKGPCGGQAALSDGWSCAMQVTTAVRCPRRKSSTLARLIPFWWSSRVQRRDGLYSSQQQDYKARLPGLAGRPGTRDLNSLCLSFLILKMIIIPT